MLSCDFIYCEGVSALIHTYSDNGMFRFESIPTNNERCVPLVVHKRRERKKLIKDDIPFGLKLFFRLLRCSSLTYRAGYAPFLAPRIRINIASAIVTVFMNQNTRIASQFSTLRLVFLHRDRRTPMAYDMSHILIGVRRDMIGTGKLQC